ncbi:GRAM domain-containing protein [Falsibacillus albus]|nr:GRAM domain-containing protein [Falsibacillus albus]
MNKSDIVYDGVANVWKGKESVGGKLYLTKNELIHKPHAVNFQREEVAISVNEIDRLDKYTNKVFGVPFAKNGLEVFTKEGESFRFVVNNRDKWIDKITNLIKNNCTNIS